MKASDLAISRILTEYSGKPKIEANLRAIITPLDDMQDTYASFLDLLSIDKAAGVNLDVLGNIVGQGRNVYLQLDTGGVFFGWDDDQNALGFGESSDDAIGGYWYEEDEALGDEVKLTDDLYRIVLKLKIMKNTFRGTLEELYTLFRSLFPNLTMQIVRTAPMEITLNFWDWTANQKIIFQGDFLPRPLGTAYTLRFL